MYRRDLKTRLIAMFVVAFVCLNAGGSACIAYCQTFDSAAAADHCPLEKTANHCDKEAEVEENTDSVGIEGTRLDCCPMTVSFFAAPIEKTSFSLSQPAVTTVVETKPTDLLVVSAASFNATFNYRGPPLIDRRVDRIKHRLLRI
jgi:hypothetical protein